MLSLLYKTVRLLLQVTSSRKSCKSEWNVSPRCWSLVAAGDSSRQFATVTVGLSWLPQQVGASSTRARLTLTFSSRATPWSGLCCFTFHPQGTAHAQTSERSGMTHYRLHRTQRSFCSETARETWREKVWKSQRRQDIQPETQNEVRIIQVVDVLKLAFRMRIRVRRV